jgi:heterotetrameric sarcosine oxidase gamma subunit
VSLEFLSPDAAATEGAFTPLARSPLAHPARVAGAVCEPRDGWEVAISYGDPGAELALARSAIGFADLSHLGKLEAQAHRDDLPAILAGGGTEPALGRAVRANGAWWAPLSAERALVICEAARLAALRPELEAAAAAAPGPAGVLDLTAAYGALALVGPMARETFARFSAIDLRPAATPVGGLRPGSVARTPGVVIREAEDRYLMLFGAALAEYVWTVVADAAESLGGGPIGVEALDSLDEPAGTEAIGRA